MNRNTLFFSFYYSYTVPPRGISIHNSSLITLKFSPCVLASCHASWDDIYIAPHPSPTTESNHSLFSSAARLAAILACSRALMSDVEDPDVVTAAAVVIPSGRTSGPLAAAFSSPSLLSCMASASGVAVGINAGIDVASVGGTDRS